MRGIRAWSASVGLVAALVLFGRLYQTDAAGQRAQLSAKPSSAPVYVGWPLPATGKAYGTIDGKHLWQYVREQADIAERYREQDHPQFWGRIAGTSGDLEGVQWLLTKYQQAGLTDTHSQTVAFFDPQWVPQSWRSRRRPQLRVNAPTCSGADKTSAAKNPLKSLPPSQTIPLRTTTCATSNSRRDQLVLGSRCGARHRAHRNRLKIGSLENATTDPLDLAETRMRHVEH